MSSYLRLQKEGAKSEKPETKQLTFFFTRILPIRTAYCFLIIICFLFSLTGCEESFQPLQNNNDSGVFSMFGYLDATADTQWVHTYSGTT